MVDQPSRVDAVGGDEPFEVGGEVRGGIPECATALESVDDLRAHRVRTAEDAGGVLDGSVGQELAHPRGRHASPGIRRAHIVDDLDVESELGAERAEEFRVTGTTATETEVAADHDQAHRERADEDVLDEGPGR